MKFFGQAIILKFLLNKYGFCFIAFSWNAFFIRTLARIQSKYFVRSWKLILKFYVPLFPKIDFFLQNIFTVKSRIGEYPNPKLLLSWEFLWIFIPPIFSICWFIHGANFSYLNVHTSFLEQIDLKSDGSSWISVILFIVRICLIGIIVIWHDMEQRNHHVIHSLISYLCNDYDWSRSFI